MTVLCASLVALAAAAGTTEPTVPSPKTDRTLISVPSNTLGPGVPLWVQRQQAEADARIALAEAAHAEARAALARTEAQVAADRPDLYFGVGSGGHGGYGGHRGVVVYGTPRPGLSRAIANRPTPPPPRLISNAHPQTPHTDSGMGFEDQGATAQRIYSEASRPPIGPSIENQLQAQRRFAENAVPPVAKAQQQRDNAVIRIRKAPKAAQ